MLNLTLSDPIALIKLCHEESLMFGIDNAEGLKWHERFKLVDKELSERVEKIFAV